MRLALENPQDAFFLFGPGAEGPVGVRRVGDKLEELFPAADAADEIRRVERAVLGLAAGKR